MYTHICVLTLNLPQYKFGHEFGVTVVKGTGIKDFNGSVAPDVNSDGSKVAELISSTRRFRSNVLKRSTGTGGRTGCGRIWKHAMLLLLAAILIFCQPVQAQNLFWDTVDVLPESVTRVEYENLGALRKMQDFSTLRKKYSASTLRGLEAKWLGGFGLSEQNIKELLLGQEGGANGGHTFIVAEGRFSPILPTEASPQRSRFVPARIGGLKGYCVPPGSATEPCIVFEGRSLAVFGRREFLSYVVERGENSTLQPLSSEHAFMDLVAAVPQDSPLWGVAQGGAADEWLKAAIPFADSVPIVWSAVFGDLNGLSYSITPDEGEVHVLINMKYKGSGGASSLGAVLEGVMAIEGVLWRRDHPEGMDPFAGAQVEVDGRLVSLGMTASEGTLQSGLVLGAGHGR